MDLVDEEDVAILEIGEQGGEIAGLGDDRARRGPEADSELAGDDLGERRLAEAGRAEEEDMVERVAAALRRLDEDPKIFPRRFLADEIVERLGTQSGVDVLRAALWGGKAVDVGHGPSLAPFVIPAKAGIQKLRRRAGFPLARE